MKTVLEGLWKPFQDLTQSIGVPVDQASQNYTKRAVDSIQGVFLKGEEIT
jgi:hypothetical protein